MSEQKRADILDTIAFLRERSLEAFICSKKYNGHDKISEILKYRCKQDALALLEGSNTLIAMYEERVKLDEA